MTKAEAIFVLEHIEAHNGLAKEAKLMAIDALKQPDIIRCKDCIYFMKSAPGHPDTEWCQRLICGTVNPEFFCADGRRKEKGDD